MAVILGGNDTLPQITLTQSQTFVPPQDGNVCIHVVGAGGSGGTRKGASNHGGAGGYCKKNSLAVTTAGSFTVVIGVGGASHRNSNAVNAGGNSTVAGTGLSATLTANGGGGAGINSSATQGAGGTAANGDVNNTGGAGLQFAGGGAVGVYGTGATGVANITGGISDATGGGIAMSGFGEIVGGTPQPMGQDNGSGSYLGLGVAGDLCGGAYAFINSNGASMTATGGYGGIGGGGGAGDGSVSVGGRGGDGIVLIQYIPS